MKRNFHKPSYIKNQRDEELIDGRLMRRYMHTTDYGRHIDFLTFLEELNHDFRLFKDTNGIHPKERFCERVSGVFDFRASKVYTVINNLHDEPQVYKIVHSHSSHKNIVFAVTDNRWQQCKTVMTDMGRNSLDKMKEKLASEFLEVQRYDSGRSPHIKGMTTLDDENNYICALRALGFKDLTVPGVRKEIAELRRKLAQAQK